MLSIFLSTCLSIYTSASLSTNLSGNSGCLYVYVILCTFLLTRVPSRRCLCHPVPIFPPVDATTQWNGQSTCDNHWWPMIGQMIKHKAGHGRAARAVQSQHRRQNPSTAIAIHFHAPSLCIAVKARGSSAHSSLTIDPPSQPPIHPCTYQFAACLSIVTESDGFWFLIPSSHPSL